MGRYGTKANFVFNLTGAVAPLVVALITVPIYVAHIGAERYGALAIIWLLLGYFGFIDLGVSRASANALAKHEHSSQAKRSAILITAFCINLVLGGIGGILVYIVGRFFLDNLLTVPQELKSELDTTFPWVSCLLPLTLVSGVAAGALESRERFLTANVLQTVGSIVGQALPVACAVFWSPSLSVIVPAAVLSRLPALLLILGFVIRAEWPISLNSFDHKRAIGLLSYGGWISATNILSPLIVSLDQLVIGSLLGLASVTYYVVPMNVVTRSQIFAAALSRTLFPRMSRLQQTDALRLTEKAMVTLAHGYALICAPAIILMSPFISFWMGSDFAIIAAPVAEILMVGAWVNGLAFIPFAHLQGQGRPDIISKYLALEIAPFAFVLWLATKEFGIVGAACIWVLRTPVHLIFMLAVIGFPGERVRALILPFAVVVAAFAFVQFRHPAPVDAALAAFTVWTIAFAFAWAFDQNLRNLVLSTRQMARPQQV